MTGFLVGLVTGLAIRRVRQRFAIREAMGRCLPERLKRRLPERVRTHSNHETDGLAARLDGLTGGFVWEATDDPTASLRDGMRAFLASNELDSERRARLERINLAISPQDEMYGTNGGVQYLGVGFSALEVIEAALEAAEVADAAIRDVLDLPSGYGRVTRFLVDRFPLARCVASDLQPSALAFCHETFGVDTVLSRQELSRLRLGRRFDLVFCGSLFTHLRESDAGDLLACLRDHLRPGGLAIITTHGQEVDRRLRAGETDLGLSPVAIDALLAEASANGFGWAGYDDFPDYGISLSTVEAVRRLAGFEPGQRESNDWREVLLLEKGWCLYQDVFVFQRVS